MHRFFFAPVLMIGLVHAVAHAQDKEDLKKEGVSKNEPPLAKKPATDEQTRNEVEILFLNGSKVRVTIQTEKLEIASIYGKLTVPVEDIEAIEFGVHYPEGMVEKINLAIKNLGSGDYRVRETAARTLLQIGPYAYPTLLRTAKVKESEVAARAKDIVEKLQAKCSKKDLRTKLEDRVVTPTQTLIGRILTPTVKTRAEYFGDIEHKLAHMRTLRAVRASSRDADVAVDAAKYAVAGQWMDTAYQVDGRSKIVISAKGLVDTWPQQPGAYMCGPGGTMRNGGFNGGQAIMVGNKVRIVGNTNAYGGVLIGKIGEDGEPFIIGDRHEFKADTEGKLYLQIGPSPWNCASTGSYDVKISRKDD